MRHNTENQLKSVGEVRHGYATGHIWECINTEGCDKAARERLISGNPDKISYIRLEAFKTSDPAVNQVRHVVVMINGKDLVIERPEAISILL